MPNFDKTGPRGDGPNTGRRKGNCNGVGNNNRGFGRCCNKNFGKNTDFSSLEEKEIYLLNELEQVRKAKENLNSDSK